MLISLTLGIMLMALVGSYYFMVDTSEDVAQAGSTIVWAIVACVIVAAGLSAVGLEIVFKHYHPHGW